MNSAEINSIFNRLMGLTPDRQTAVLFMTIGATQATIEGNPKAKLSEYFRLLEHFVSGVERTQAAKKAAA
ncbi:MAG: hypothetical protein H2172_12520 [Opitutus sp.]|nr:hypothetical protein [Opitutus sp.]MCS6248696.1 hypothetical protein [Opitutus sp.]MCS6275564.1 hypothetical protein [Opitutus sp.]MCS6275909.1 hypothetical protein [Opitutus sp.]MCS6301006.1 hypothetical protein [Opitutus sp.]